jgi:hypothetical protein
MPASTSEKTKGFHIAIAALPGTHGTNPGDPARSMSCNFPYDVQFSNFGLSISTPLRTTIYHIATRSGLGGLKARLGPQR